MGPLGASCAPQCFPCYVRWGLCFLRDHFEIVWGFILWIFFLSKDELNMSLRRHLLLQVKVAEDAAYGVLLVYLLC